MNEKYPISKKETAKIGQSSGECHIYIERERENKYLSPQTWMILYILCNSMKPIQTSLITYVMVPRCFSAWSCFPCLRHSLSWGQSFSYPNSFQFSPAQSYQKRSGREIRLSHMRLHLESKAKSPQFVLHLTQEPFWGLLIKNIFNHNSLLIVRKESFLYI